TTADGLTLTVNGKPATTAVISSLTLTPREDIIVNVASASGESKTYTVHYLPPDFPAYSVTNPSPTLAGSEPILLTPALGWLAIVDRAGAPLYYRRPPAPIGTTPATVADFRPQTFDTGQRGYSYAVQNEGIHLLDDHFREKTTLSVLANRDHGVIPADVHDFLVLGPEHYLLLGYAPKTLDLSEIDDAWSTQAPVTAAVIQEVDHGVVLFEWDSDDAPSLFTDSVFSNAFTDAATSDYVHANSFQIDPVDGNLIVSLRHTSSILKISRTTGATLWTLGGKSDDFGLTAAQRTAFQHHANKQSDGTLLVFDNGALSPAGDHPTRVVSYVLDESAKTVTSFTEITTRPSAQPDTTFMGSAFMMNANRYLIGWGGRSDSSATWPAVTEVAGGSVVWSLTFTTPSTFSYRAHPMTP
ncbi:MAG: hypothetical protein JWO86_2624, partial [Myxococcaceae bacterium]|nr:hypothetical protein [Myxococcaceae bacterium]